MQIKKSKGVVTIKLTQYELRQLAGAQDIIDTVRSLGGSVEDVSSLVDSDGVVTFGKKAESLFDDQLEDKEAVEAPLEDVAPVKPVDKAGPRVKKS